MAVQAPVSRQDIVVSPKCRRCGELGHVVTVCTIDPKNLQDKRYTLVCFDFEDAQMGNDSAKKGMLHCGKENCIYIHKHAKDPVEKVDLQERWDKLQEKKESDRGANKGKGKGKGKGKSNS